MKVRSVLVAAALMLAGAGAADLLDDFDAGLMRCGTGVGHSACGACDPPDPLGSNTDFNGLPMFIRGGLVTDWGAVAGLNSFSDQTEGLYIARFEMNAGMFEWKIADEGWAIEYCTETNLQEQTPTTAPLFGCLFPANGTITVPSNGCYEFQMQTDGRVPPVDVSIGFASFTDTDGDGVGDDTDNCLELANADQRDTDADGIGNLCDQDIAEPNDCDVSFEDLNALKLVFFTSNPDADFDGDGEVGFTDLNLMKLTFFTPPGPSASGCN